MCPLVRRMRADLTAAIRSGDAVAVSEARWLGAAGAATRAAGHGRQAALLAGYLSS